MWALGITSFKHYFNAYKPRPTERLSWLGGPSDAGMLLRSLRFCAERGTPGICVLHCEDIDIVAVLEDELRAAGRAELGAWSDARPERGRVLADLHGHRPGPDGTGTDLHRSHVHRGGRRARRGGTPGRLARVGGSAPPLPDP